MDPLTAGLVAGAVPMALGMMMPSPQMPRGPDYSQAYALYNSPELTSARNQIYQGAFNDPNQNRLYQLASGQAMASMNRQLAARGIGNTGFGMGALNQTSTDLANNFYQNQLNRQQEAYKTMASMIPGMANISMQQQNEGYQNSMAQYQAQVQNQGNFMNAINRGVGAGMQMSQYNNQLAQQMQQQQMQQQMMQYMMYGPPGQSAATYTPPAMNYSLGNNYSYGPVPAYGQ